MNELVSVLEKFFVGRLTTMDFFAAFIIVALDEYVIKKTILKSNEKYKAVYTFAPLALGLVIYVVYFLSHGMVWYNGVLQGLMVGLTAMGSYDVILRIGKGKVDKGMDEIGKAIEEEVKK